MATQKTLPRLHFVDENDPEKRHKSRAHLARELHRMKRQHRKVYPSNLPVSPANVQLDQFKWPVDVVVKAACPPTADLPLHLLKAAQDRCLFHHYSTVMPELYRARWKHMGNANAVRDLFQLYCRDEVSFRALLFDAATHRSALQGIPAPLEYENQLVRSIRSNLHTLNSGVILGTILLCSLKCMGGSDGTSHWLAFREMIMLHGGLSSFKGDHLMFTKLIWTFIALPGPLTGFDCAPDLEFGLKDLNDLLRSRQKALVDLLPTSEVEMDRLSDLRRVKAFQASTLKRLLQTPTSEYPTERNCRLAVILFLTSALMLHGDFDPATDSCIEAISQHLEGARDDAAISPVHLLWFLTRLTVSATIGERYAQVWIGVIRMLAAFHRLAPSVQKDAERLLFVSLEMPEMYEQIPAGWGLDGELRIDADPARRDAHDRSVPAECFCELLWFTAPPDE
ncbi:uncharacterized protein Z520_10432 [Fonsecaea multimorphosa CBS 102226]|uniref:Uncharacterized protein n=1 Tax=Fonsecaea multimorphosa CBS 102226 TaxID=1442371 RepID=A0A0D2JKL8_9EURO|nr:uncharacterized protein Z520_10432 [Fonsecaea multimorphosa CBS 102226]KIX93807.1 hypothetical protein Z520_10432 [Fonsecaea multimorphosa CBS 102226]OAL19236.1 hypothetical protein AYO22_09997 [Fonsecaea multimorphosa]